MRRWARPLPAALLLAALIGGWELYVDAGAVDRLILPAPRDVARALYDDRAVLWSNFLVSAKEIVLGSLVAAAAGVLLAVAMHFSRLLRQACYPLTIASQTVPVPIFAPLLVLWLGFGLSAKLVDIAVVSFFSVVIAFLAGLAAVDPDLPKLMRTFGAGRWRTFRHVELPSALPGLFTGLKLTLVVTVIADVLAEQAGTVNGGLGFILLSAPAQLLTAEAFAAALILSLFAILLFALLTAAERRLLPWAHQPRGEGRR